MCLLIHGTSSEFSEFHTILYNYDGGFFNCLSTYYGMIPCLILTMCNIVLIVAREGVYIVLYFRVRILYYFYLFHKWLLRVRKCNS